MKISVRSGLFSLFLLFSILTHAVEPLPARLINFSSKEGQKALENSATGNSTKLLSHFTTQQTTTYCGVAGAVMVLNSSNLVKPADPQHEPYHYFTQEDFFNDRVKQIITPEEVLKNGITLAQLNQIMQSYALTSKAYHADQLDLKKFRRILKKALTDQNFVIVNFLRTGLNQVGGGHHSPLAAYDEKHDRFLLLDVARYKYPSYWVKTQDLWNATNTIDKDANASRGILIIEP